PAPGGPTMPRIARVEDAARASARRTSSATVTSASSCMRPRLASARVAAAHRIAAMRTKKSLAAWLAGLAAVSLFTACSGDDPETPTPDGTQQVETGAPADPGDTNPPPVE